MLSIQKLNHFFESKYPIDGLGKELLERFSEVSLIGEIELEEDEGTYRHLREILRENDGRRLHDILTIGSSQSNAILSFLMVFTARFEYGDGWGNDLWPHVERALGRDICGSWFPRQGDLGERFLRCLKTMV